MSFNDEWEEVKLRDVAEYSKNRINVERINLNNYISTSNMIPDKGGITKADKLPTTKSVIKFDKEDILISNIRPYFKKIWSSNKEGGCSNDVLVIKSDDTINSQFLYYFLSQDIFFDYVMGTAKGTKMPRGDKKAIMKYSVNLPSLKEQKAIADTLSVLDEKIELNNQMNETLEEMAQAIYKSWFVGFEPFQDEEFVDSELGKIPKGWEVKQIKEVSKVVLGKTPSTKKEENYGDKYPFIKIPDMHNKMFIVKTEKRLSEKGHKTQAKKLLPENSISVSCIGTIGLVTINSEPSHTNQQINSIVAEDRLIEYLYFNMKNMKEKLFKLGGGGTTIRNVNKGTFSKVKIIKPDDKTLDEFHKNISPIFKKIKENLYQNKTLTQLRDTLLPKLMSGEIRVPSED